MEKWPQYIKYDGMKPYTSTSRKLKYQCESVCRISCLVHLLEIIYVTTAVDSASQLDGKVVCPVHQALILRLGKR